MSNQTSTRQLLANGIVDRVEAVVTGAQEADKPIEIDPYRGQLFELFVTAEGAGYLDEDGDPDADLTSDGLCRALAQRWGLADATRASLEQQTRLPPQELARMRLLWSVMRMWMEWSYAWQRWSEFH